MKVRFLEKKLECETNSQLLSEKISKHTEKTQNSLFIFFRVLLEIDLFIAYV